MTGGRPPGTRPPDGAAPDGPPPDGAAPAGAAPADPLPCGRDGLAVVDRARAGDSTEHERSCPHCRQRIDDDTASRAARLALAADEQAHDVPPNLLPDVMRTVWSDLRRPRLLSLAAPGGPAFVAQHVVSAVIGDALETRVQLQVRTCTVPADGTAPALAVRIRAAAAHGVDLIDLAAQARAIVVATVRTQFGRDAVPVDIDIVDLYQPESPDDRR